MDILSKAICFIWYTGLEEWIIFLLLGCMCFSEQELLEVEQSTCSLDQANAEKDVAVTGQEQKAIGHLYQVLPCLCSCWICNIRGQIVPYKKLISRRESDRVYVNFIDSSSSASFTIISAVPRLLLLWASLPALAVSLYRTSALIHWLLHQMSKMCNYF